MEKSRKLSKRLNWSMAIIVLFMALCCISTFSIFDSKAENNSNSNLIISNDNGVKRVDNIQNYFAKTNSYRSNNNEAVNNYLRALEYTEEEIIQMSDEQINELTSASYVMLASTEYTVDEGEKFHSPKMTITTRLLRTPNRDTNVRAYKMMATAFWNQSPGYRLKDILAINATNGTTYGKASDGSRVSKLMYNEYYTAYGYGKNFTYTAPHSKIEELPINNSLYAIRANLPNDLIGIGAANTCSLITVFLECELYNNNTFNVFTSYGHKYIGGKAEVTLKDANFKFNGECTEYAGIMLAETTKK